MTRSARDVALFRQAVGGRRRLIASGRFCVGYAYREMAPDDERQLTVLNFEQTTQTLMFEIKPHDIGDLIENLITVVVNHNVIPKGELLGNIVGPMPYDTIAEMINFLPEDARRHVKAQIKE